MTRTFVCLLTAGTLWALGASPAAAAAKSCDPVKAKIGGTSVVWKAHRIRLSEGFRCKDARQDIRSWIGLGGYMTDSKSMPPWTCQFDARITCRLRTSFGGTRPERTYRLSFVVVKLR